MTLADMYDPEKMPNDLREAHKNLDLAVDKLYRKKPFANDEDRLRHLFKLYAGLLKGQSVAEQGLFDEEE